MISYSNCDSAYNLKARRLNNNWLRQVAAEEGFKIGEVAIVFCSDEYLLGVNRQFLGHDYYTDIITFDYCEGKVLSGDLLISIDSVRENAKTYGSDFDEELRRVMVHGILHLIGYDDHSDEEQKEMRSKENHYLCKRATM